MKNDLNDVLSEEPDNVYTKTEHSDLPENDAQIKIDLPEERVPTDSTSGLHSLPPKNDDTETHEDNIESTDKAKEPLGEAGSDTSAQADEPIFADTGASSDTGTSTASDEDEAKAQDDSTLIDDSEDAGDEPEPTSPDENSEEKPLASDGDSLPAEDKYPPPKDDEDYVQISLFDDENGDLEKATDKEPEEDEEQKKYDPDHPRFIDSIFDFVELFIFSLVAVLLATTFLFRHTVVDGSSMEKTLYDGEHLIISNLFYTPQRGDIIVCVDYSTVHKKPIVKRVIGLPGDEVKVYSNGAVYVNGEKLEENYVYNDFIAPQEYIEKTVEEGRLFVMGDHRNLSSDSRTIGTIDMDSVLGRVIFRFYPFDKFGKVE